MKHPGGRPPKYTSPAEMARVGNAYLDQQLAEGKPLTVTGLAIALGFCERKALIDYTGKEQFRHVVKSLKARVEQWIESRMYGNQVAGAIFVLKNMGWSDKQDIGLSTPNGPIETRFEVILHKPKDA
jgi:hypothetical protein